jgi:hypothetical protein
MHHEVEQLVVSMYGRLPQLVQDSRGFGVDLTMDAASVAGIARALGRLKLVWNTHFGQVAEPMARKFAESAMKAHDVSFKHTLTLAGFGAELGYDATTETVRPIRPNFKVKFQKTPEMDRALDKVIHDNVHLIKSIPGEHLDSVEKIVRESAEKGRDVAGLQKELKERFNVTKERVELIARDQNNKATAAYKIGRCKELGLTKAQWVHTAASVTPRPEHEAWDGEEFDLEEGMYSEEDGENVWPGTPINCLTGDSPIELADGCKQLWRRRYTGELTVLVTESGKSFKATPNHPILTRRGWLPIQSINVGDDVVCIPDQVIDRIKTHEKSGIPTFQELFETIQAYLGSDLRYSSSSLSIGRIDEFEFHGDMANGEVETVDIDGLLSDEFDPTFCKDLCKFIFTCADEVRNRFNLPIDTHLQTCISRLFTAPQSVIRGFASLLPLLKGSHGCSDDVRFASIADMNTRLNESITDTGTAGAIALGKFKLTNAGLVIGDNCLVRKLFGLLAKSSSAWGFDPIGAQTNTDIPHADSLGDLAHCETFTHKLDRIIDKRSGNLSSGHVYNLHNEMNWFTSQGLVYHNCGCTQLTLIPGWDYDEKETGEDLEEAS